MPRLPSFDTSTASTIRDGVTQLRDWKAPGLRTKGPNVTANAGLENWPFWQLLVHNENLIIIVDLSRR